MIVPRPDIKNPFQDAADREDIPYDFEEIGDIEEFKQLVENVSFIGAVDTKGRGCAIAYGLETLIAYVSDGIPAQEMRGIVFALDFETALPEVLCASVYLAKGSFDWHLAPGCTARKRPQRRRKKRKP